MKAFGDAKKDIKRSCLAVLVRKIHKYIDEYFRKSIVHRKRGRFSSYESPCGVNIAEEFAAVFVLHSCHYLPKIHFPSAFFPSIENVKFHDIIYVEKMSIRRSWSSYSENENENALCPLRFWLFFFVLCAVE